MYKYMYIRIDKSMVICIIAAGYWRGEKDL